MSFDLSNQYVSQSYQNLVQISGSILTTGLGTSINQLTVTGVTASLIGTSSWAINAVTASYANFAANSNIATTGSTLYSTNPITSNVATVNSIFLGTDAGRDATNANSSNFLGATAGYEATNAESSNFIGIESGYQATNANNSNFIGTGAGYQATNAIQSNFLGAVAGYQATGASQSNFFGFEAGSGATSANNSNFIGNLAGNGATEANNSNFFGGQAGSQATNANDSNFLGKSAGSEATDANDSNFLGEKAGFQATNANDSNFLGFEAGRYASEANNSNFFGNSAGNGAISASYSNLFGYYVGSNNIGSNNIIIGTNVTLANGRKDSINLGGIIFATGSHNSLATKLSGSVTNAKVGICNSLPQYTLDVSGSGKFTDGVNVTGSLLSIGEVNLKNPYNSNIQLLITGSYDPLGLGDPSNVVATQAQSASISTGFGTGITTGSNASLATSTYCRNSASGDLVVVSADYASNDNTLGVGLTYVVNNVTDVLSIGVSPDTVYTINSKTASGSSHFTALNGDNDRILELYNNGDYVQTNVTSSIAFVNLGNAVVSEFTQSFAGITYTKDSGGDDWLIANATIVGISGSNTVIANQNILVDNNSNQRTEIINTVSNEIDGVQYIKISHENTSTDDIHQVSVSPYGATIESDTTNEGPITLAVTSGSVYIGDDPLLGLTTMTITNSGHVILPFVSSSFNYANDAAAALGNVPLGGVYHTSGSLKIRLT